MNALWTWILTHQLALLSTASAIVVLCRAIPAAHWQRLEREWPRLANVARLLRALFPDVLKAAKTIYAIWTGRPWPTLPSAPEVRR